MAYQIHKKISSDAYFDYHIGRIEGQRGFKKTCLFKFLKDRYQADADHVDMLLDEATTNAYLQHKGIVQIHELIEIDGRYGLVMDYSPSVTLEDLNLELHAQNTKLSLMESVYIASELADALHFAHSAVNPVNDKPLDIVHCTVSPANIVLTEAGEIKLTNFSQSLSKLKTKETQSLSLQAKFNYFSPEQRYGVKLSFRSDCYSLGVVLWECLAGRSRYEEFELSRHGDNDELDPELKNLTEIVSEFDSELSEIVARATAINPEDRYVSCAGFSKVLKIYLRKYDPNFDASKFRSMLRKIMKERLLRYHEDIQQSLTEPFREDYKPKIIDFDNKSSEVEAGGQIYRRGRDLVLTTNQDVVVPAKGVVPQATPSAPLESKQSERSVQGNQKSAVPTSRFANRVAKSTSSEPSTLTVIIVALLGAAILVGAYFIRMRRS